MNYGIFIKKKDRDVIQTISAYLSLEQRIEWGIYASHKIKPFIKKQFHEHINHSILIGQLWLDGKDKMEIERREYRIEIFEEHFQKKKETTGVVVYGEDKLWWIGAGTSSPNGYLVGAVGALGSMAGIAEIFNVLALKRRLSGGELSLLIHSIINCGLDLAVINKPFKIQMALLKVFSKAKGLSTIQYLEKCSELSELHNEKAGN